MITHLQYDALRRPCKPGAVLLLDDEDLTRKKPPQRLGRHSVRRPHLLRNPVDCAWGILRIAPRCARINIGPLHRTSAGGPTRSAQRCTRVDTMGRSRECKAHFCFYRSRSNSSVGYAYVPHQWIHSCHCIQAMQHLHLLTTCISLSLFWDSS